MLFLTAVSLKRRPPPFESSGLSFELIEVSKDTSNAKISYGIKATPVECGFGFPLLEICFLQVTHSSNLCDNVILKTNDIVGAAMLTSANCRDGGCSG